MIRLVWGAAALLLTFLPAPAFAIDPAIGQTPVIEGRTMETHGRRLAQAKKQELDRNQCVIKGNISARTGERIYHVPGGQYYRATRINPAKGERYFCSEREARAAGWRKSKR